MMNIKKIFVSFMISAVVLTAVPITSMADSTGWRGSSSDGWRYYTSDTEYVKDSWKQIGGVWYYFYSDGKAVTDSWAFIDGKLYHFDKNGAMEKNKWIDCGEHDFSKNRKNPEYQNLRDWRYVGPDGAAYTGWKKVNGEWYCFIDDVYMKAIGCEDQKDYALMVYGQCCDANMTTLYDCDSNGRYRRNTWYQDNIGRWSYYKADGSTATGWEKINNKWYFFSGYNLVTSPITIGNGTNFQNKKVWMISPSGALSTTPGWQKSGARWYYVKSDGTCYCDTWLKLDGKWYYFNFYGEMIFDKQDLFIDGKKYNFDSNGVCTNYTTAKPSYGFNQVSAEDESWVHQRVSTNRAETYYVGTDGVLYRDKWLKTDGKWYYFYSNGRMANSYDQIIDGKSYSFAYTGECLDHDNQNFKGWYESPKAQYHYYGDDGKLKLGWQKINNKWYYFMQTSGIMAYGGLTSLLETGNIRDFYYFGIDGDMQTGWIESDNGWYYAASNGVIYRNKWLNSNGKWYYFDTLGQMLADTSDYIIDGRVYDFDSNGVCLNPNGSKVLIF